MIFGIFGGFLAVMVGLLLAGSIVIAFWIILGKSCMKVLTRFINALKGLFTKVPVVKEIHTIYEEDGVKKEKVEVMK